MSPEPETTIDPAYEVALQLWAEKVRNTWEEDLYDLWESKEGLKIELDGVYHWAYNVKVRRPWKLFGKETLELHGIFESGQSFPIIDSMSAGELIEATIGSLLVWLPRNIVETTGYTVSLTAKTPIGPKFWVEEISSHQFSEDWTWMRKYGPSSHCPSATGKK